METFEMVLVMQDISKNVLRGLCEGVNNFVRFLLYRIF